MNSWSKMVGGFNRLVSKEIRSRQWYISKESEQTGYKTLCPSIRIFFIDCGLCRTMVRNRSTQIMGGLKRPFQKDIRSRQWEISKESWQTGFKTSYVSQLGFLHCEFCRDGGHEQLISNTGRFKPACVERDKKQAMRDLQGIWTNWF